MGRISSSSGPAPTGGSGSTRTTPDRLADLPERSCRLYKQSLLILRTQIDDDGAIIAANDFDISSSGRDTYSYMWPRDGALVADALIAAGYSTLPRRFFDFCAERHHPARATCCTSTTRTARWPRRGIPWYRRTARSTCRSRRTRRRWCSGRSGSTSSASATSSSSSRSTAARHARRPTSWPLSATRRPACPRPRYDLWEERRGVHAFTVGAVWARARGGGQLRRGLRRGGAAGAYRQPRRTNSRGGARPTSGDAERGASSRMMSAATRTATLERGPDARRRARRPLATSACSPPTTRDRRDDGRRSSERLWVQDRRRRRGALRGRQLPPRQRRRRPRPGQPVVHLHALAGRVAHRDGADAGRPERGRRDPGVGRPRTPCPAACWPSRSTRTPASRSPSRPSPGATPFDKDAEEELALNPDGLDAEGLVRTADGGFWLAEEYRPSLLKIDATGKVVARYIPAGVELRGGGIPGRGDPAGDLCQAERQPWLRGAGPQRRRHDALCPAAKPPAEPE